MPGIQFKPIITFFFFFHSKLTMFDHGKHIRGLTWVDHGLNMMPYFGNGQPCFDFGFTIVT